MKCEYCRQVGHHWPACGNRTGKFINAQLGKYTYKGQFKHDKPYGTGESTYKDGSKYIGEWENGKRHGKGVFIEGGNGSHVSTIEGIWIRDQLANGIETFGISEIKIKHVINEIKPIDGKMKYVIHEIKPIDDKIEPIDDKIEPIEKQIFIDVHERSYTYEGTLRDGKPHGKGIATYFEEEHIGIHYEGDFFEGKRHGMGKITWNLPHWSSGSMFEGEYENGLSKYGYVITINKDGSKYEGERFESKPHGFGIYTWPTGNIYEGEWVHGNKCGKYKYTSVNGEVCEGICNNKTSYIFHLKQQNGYVVRMNNYNKYEGNYESNEKNGYGVMIYNYKNIGNEDKIYRGEWKDNKKHGYGIETKPILSYHTFYEGEWKDNNYYGNGKYVGKFEEEEGVCRYEGEWKNGKRDGQGVLITAKGERYDGKWKNGKRHGHGVVYRWTGASKYDGEWKDGEKNGYGVYTYRNGSSHTGYYKNGLENGEGVWESNGEKFEGFWYQGRRNGHGIYTRPNGCIYEGKWEDFKKNGLFKKTDKDGNITYNYYTKGVENKQKTQKIQNISMIIDEDCSICNETIIYNVSITECDHKFHTKCLTKWSCKHNSCPLCRSKLYD